MKVEKVMTLVLDQVFHIYRGENNKFFVSTNEDEKKFVQLTAESARSFIEGLKNEIHNNNMNRLNVMESLIKKEKQLNFDLDTLQNILMKVMADESNHKTESVNTNTSKFESKSESKTEVPRKNGFQPYSGFNTKESEEFDKNVRARVVYQNPGSTNLPVVNDDSDIQRIDFSFTLVDGKILPDFRDVKDAENFLKIFDAMERLKQGLRFHNFCENGSAKFEVLKTFRDTIKNL